MVNLPPPEPNDRQPARPSRDNDEAIAIAIAFLTIGAILWWGWTRGQQFLGPIVNLPGSPDTVVSADDPAVGLNAAESDEGFTPFAGRDRGRAGDSMEAAPRSQRRIDSIDIDKGRDRTVIGSSAAAIAGANAAPAVTADAAADLENETTEASEALPELDISDVSADYWAYPYIVSLYEEGLLPNLPSGELQPDKELTRAELAALLNSSFVGAEQPKRSLNFTDIAPDYWAAAAIKQVVDAGYMTGFPDETFKPNELVPRYQVLITLATGLDLAPPSDVDATLNPLQGAQNLPGWARPQVAAAAAEGIIVNHPDPQQLEPQQPATRAELIAIIHEALVTQGRLEPIDTPFAVPAQ